MTKKMILRYQVKTRYGTCAEVSTRREAERLYRAERRDGWPTWIRRMADGALVR